MMTDQTDRKSEKKEFIKSILTFEDYGSITLHAGAIGVVAAGAFVFFGPAVVAVGAGVGAVLALREARGDLAEHHKIFERYDEARAERVGLAKSIKQLAAKAGLKRVPNLYRQKKVDYINAFLHQGVPKDLDVSTIFESDGKEVGVYFPDEAVKVMTSLERRAVLAHEITHVALGAKQSVVGEWGSKKAYGAVGIAGFVAAVGEQVLTGGSVMWGVVMGATYGALRFARSIDQGQTNKGRKLDGVIAASVGAIMLGSVLPVVQAVAEAAVLALSSTLAWASWRRQNEYWADRGAVRLGADPLALGRAMHKTNPFGAEEQIREQLQQFNAPTVLDLFRDTGVALFSQHPNDEKRYKALAEEARRQGKSEEQIEGSLYPHKKVVQELHAWMLSEQLKALCVELVEKDLPNQIDIQEWPEGKVPRRSDLYRRARQPGAPKNQNALSKGDMKQGPR